MMKGMKKTAVLGICAGLVLTSLAGCSKKETFDREAAAITVNDQTVSAGVVNFGLRYNQANYESLYMSLGLTDPFNQDMYGAGTTLGDDMKNVLTQELTNAMLAEQKAGEYGVALTDEQKSAIADAAKGFIDANEEEVLKELSITEEDAKRYLELSTIRTMTEKEMSADVDTEVSDEEAAQRKIQYVLFTPITDEDLAAETETEEAQSETAQSDSEEVQTESAEETETESESDAQSEAAESETAAETEEETAQLTEKEDVKTQSSDETETESESAKAEETEAAESEETETEAAETETEDPEAAEAMERALIRAEEMLGKLQDGAEFDKAAEEMGKTASTTTFGSDYSITELAEATEGLADGTLVETPVKTANGYYVVKVLSELDREATDAKKESIVKQRKQEQISALYTEWKDAGKVTVDEKVMAGITFDYHLTQPTEAQTEAVSETESEVVTKAVSETESEAATEAVSETESETATEAVSETESETATEVAVETESEAVTEAAVETDSEAVTEA